MNIDAALLTAYGGSYFFLNKELDFNEFAVITAWNPFSKQLSNRDNRHANRQLSRQILKQNYELIEVGDINRGWIEESFAVETRLQQAWQLGKQYRQNAIYYVKDDWLYLVSCVGEEAETQFIGRFSERVIRQECFGGTQAPGTKKP